MSREIFRRCGCRTEDGKQYRVLPERPTEADRVAACPQMSDAKHGRWGYRVSAGTDPATGKRRVVTKMVGTLRDTQKARTVLRASLDSRTYRSDQRVKVGDFLEEWLEGKVANGLKPSTTLMYSRYIAQDLVPAFGAVRLSELTERHVESLLRDLQRAGRGVTTIRRIHATLRSALSSAKRQRLVSSNVADDVDLPAQRQAKLEPWSPEELGQFLEHVAGHRLAPLFEFEVFSGLRRGELAGLRWSDVDLDAGVAWIRSNLVVVGGAVTEASTKTASGERRVDIGGRAIAALVRQRELQDLERDQWGDAWTDAGRVFTREDGRDLQPQTLTKTFNRLTVDAGLRRIRFHDLRHTAASLMMAAGIDIALVSKRMGHSTISVTSDIYGHLSAGAGRRAADAAESLVPVTPVRRASNQGLAEVVVLTSCAQRAGND
jgi:integrase